MLASRIRIFTYSRNFLSHCNKVSSPSEFIRTAISSQCPKVIALTITENSRRCFSTSKLTCIQNTSNGKEKETKIRIYYGSLTSRMKAVKLFSIMTSLTGLAAQPVILEQSSKLGGTPMAIFMCGFAGFFTFVTPLLLHFITKKYVTNIYYDPKTDEYTATTISIILRKLQHKFKVGDVKVPEVPGMFTSFYIGKTPLFVEPTQFSDTEHYVKMMGYDKPIDLKLNVTSVPEETNEKNMKK